MEIPYSSIRNLDYPYKIHSPSSLLYGGGDCLARLGHMSALEMGCHGEQSKVQRATSLRRQKDSVCFFHVHFELVLTSASKMSRRRLKVWDLNLERSLRSEDSY